MTSKNPMNIEKDGCKIRLLIGILLLLFSLLLTILLIGLDTVPLWRVLVILPWSISLLNLLQAHRGIDVVMAIRGFEDTITGRQKLTNPKQLAQVQIIARRIILQTLFLATVLTILSVLIPSPDLQHIFQLLQNRGH